MVKIIIEAQQFINLLPLTSNEDTRYYLKGVYIERDKSSALNLVATDGTVLGFYQVLDKYFTNFNLNQKGGDKGLIVGVSKDFETATKKRIKTNDKMNLNTYLIIDGDLVNNQAIIAGVPKQDAVLSIFDSIIESGAKSKYWQLAEGGVLIDGTYPDYKRVMPDQKLAEGAIISVDLKNLMRFDHLAANGGRCSQLTILATDQNGPMLVRTWDETFTGVVMPMKINSKHILVMPTK